MAEVDRPDPKLELTYQESLRALEAQRSLTESLRGRAGTLIFATAFVSSLLGGQALSDGLDPWDWAGLVLLVIIGFLAVLIVWPYRTSGFRSDVDEMIKDFVEADVSVNEMRRQLAHRMQEDRLRNIPIIRRMRIAFMVALVGLVGEIVVWLIALSR